MKKINKSKLFYLIIFIILLLICYFFPYTGDDWAWGTNIGVERLLSGFKDYNGRYLGNLMVLLLTRSRILRAIIMSITLFVIPLLISRIVSNKQDKINKNIYLSTLLILLIPTSIFQQSISWTSGFCNYVFPIVFILIYLLINKEIKSKKQNNNLKLSFICFILGFVSTLFIEHMTIYAIILAIFLVFYNFIIEKKFKTCNVSFLIGVLIGAAIMFSNGAYVNVLNSADTYRSVKTSNPIFNIISSYFNTISNYLFTNNFILNIFMSFISLKLLYDALKNENHKFKKVFYKLLMFFYVSFIIYSLFNNFYLSLFGIYKKYIDGLISLIFLILSFVMIIFTINSKEKKQELLFYLISICLITGPLFFVTPVGPRCFFPTYIIFVLYITTFVDYISFSDKLIFLIKTSIVIMFLIYIFIFVNVFIVDNKRQKLIKNGGNSEKLVLPKLPYESYLWYANPTDDVFVERFKLFYNVDKDKFVEFN